MNITALKREIDKIHAAKGRNIRVVRLQPGEDQPVDDETGDLVIYIKRTIINGGAR